MTNSNDIVKIFMDGMKQKSNGWIFCNDYQGTTPITQNAYQKRLTAKQVKWLTDVSMKSDRQLPIRVREGSYLDGSMDNTTWSLFIHKNNSGVLTIKHY